MGLLAGSTVALLTIIWRTFTVVGKCDIRDTIAETTKTLKASILKMFGPYAYSSNVETSDHGDHWGVDD
ncbi:hypothetical protein IGI04_030103 [Brassica rapa subsp. trilocularis]|uniref:ABC transmembrane type-1 domain-containing protein n=1 Tax=Brassica rapa subsp. trilocularis TaxID=1813537 RepID=A0ABQ7LPQ5_BRACM|nr:hypothetical protein IGI04_030103 [Brassica rapa subsp. trilocularis]